MKGPHAVYLIQSGSRSYVGYTNDIKNRMRCHARIIKGGAKKTEGWGKTLRLVAYVEGFETYKKALSYEWHANRHRKLKAQPEPNPRIPLNCDSRLLWFLRPTRFSKFKDWDLTLNLADNHGAADKLENHYPVYINLINFEWAGKVCKISMANPRDS